MWGSNTFACKLFHHIKRAIIITQEVRCVIAFLRAVEKVGDEIANNECAWCAVALEGDACLAPPVIVVLLCWPRFAGEHKRVVGKGYLRGRAAFGVRDRLARRGPEGTAGFFQVN